MFDAIFFDLDGTLLPMDNDTFINGYLGSLCENVSAYGYSKEALIPAMWKGVAAMVKNDGSRKNSEVFWKTFADLMGDQVYDHIKYFDKFYSGNFKESVKFTKPGPLSKKAVEIARTKTPHVVLATNPWFPQAGVETRLNWVGLTADDFELVTNYDNSGTCKPNPAYYIETANKINVKPENCLMVGNNVKEDALAAMEAGLSAYLITDCILNDSDTLPDCPHGTFEEFIEYLNQLS
ncbi:MAG: HAD family hydrolase [Clostridia bacterium]|nr:HAD family hydrolase [Clostridia bacterium]